MHLSLACERAPHFYLEDVLMAEKQTYEDLAKKIETSRYKEFR